MVASLLKLSRPQPTQDETLGASLGAPTPMKLKVLGCYGGNIPGHGMTSFLVNDALALDAGWVSNALSLKEQEKVKDILISHSHLDHTCTLPFLIDNNFTAPGFSLRIYAIPEVISSMRNHLFNNHTWPDFTCLPNDMTPVLEAGRGRAGGAFRHQRHHHPRRPRVPQRAHGRATSSRTRRAPSPSRATRGPPSASGSWSTR